MPEQLNESARARPWLTRLVTTLAAWLVAFLIVLALLTLFGRKLESLPHALNALVFTGVLVPIMGNLVMPVVSAAVTRWLAGPPRTSPAEDLRTMHAAAADQHSPLEAPTTVPGHAKPTR